MSTEVTALLDHCVRRRLWSEQDEGPYYRFAQPDRRDVVEDRDGAALQLGIRLTDEDGGPRQDATVEIWHCDALGRYSGFPPPGAPAVHGDPTSTDRGRSDETFLRGRQVTDSDGTVEFRTIYPGWYPGRTLHIHLAVQTAGALLISQLYFPEELSVVVLASPPYRDRPGRDTTNLTDEILPTGGDAAVLDVLPAGRGYRAAGWLITPP